MKKLGEAGSPDYRLVLIGPLVDEEELHEHEDVSPAAAAWFSRLATCLEEFGDVGHADWFSLIRAFPRGPLVVDRKTLRNMISGRTLDLVSFMNIPFIKKMDIRRKLVSRLSSRSSRPVLLIVYGAETLSLNQIISLREAVERVVLIVADMPATYRSKRLLDRLSRQSHVKMLILPYSLYVRLGEERTVYFPGVMPSVQALGEPKFSGVKRFLYVGGLDVHGGSKFLAESLKSIQSHIGKDVEILVAGRVSDKAAQKYLIKAGVKMLGFLSQEQLAKLCTEVHAFLNPRDPRLSETAYNFPSKLLLYMAFSRPIISTKTLGISDELADAMTWNYIVKPLDFGKAIVYVSRMSQPEWQEAKRKLNDFSNINYSMASCRKVLHKELFSSQPTGSKVGS